MQDREYDPRKLIATHDHLTDESSCGGTRTGAGEKQDQERPGISGSSLAVTLLTRLRQGGFSVRAEGGKVLISPISRLSTEDRKEVVAHRLQLISLLNAESTLDARNQAVQAVEPPDFRTGSVLLETYDLIRVSEAGEEPEYLAVPPGWYEGLIEFAALRKRDQQQSQARSEKKRKKKSGPIGQGDLLCDDPARESPC